jgi:S-(hydroxymethyl)glutathione dehydrogenase/alcohol dehydrogenase
MTHFVNPKTLGDQDIVAHLVELTKGGADYSFECIGNVQTMRQRSNAAHKGWGEASSSASPVPARRSPPARSSWSPAGSWRGTAFGGARAAPTCRRSSTGTWREDQYRP